jgi:hypothetical protein
MSSSRIGALALGVALACGASAALAADAHSSLQDRARFVSIAHGLEQEPLKSGTVADRAWVITWLTDAPDVSVTICPEMLKGLIRSKYPYVGEVMIQDPISMAAFVIEHPEANDPNRQQLAGVEGALTAYRSILRDKPEAKSPDLEALLQMQSRGELPDFVRKAWVSCSVKK